MCAELIECEVCSTAVYDLGQHRAWHARVNPPCPSVCPSVLTGGPDLPCELFDGHRGAHAAQGGTWTEVDQ